MLQLIHCKHIIYFYQIHQSFLYIISRIEYFKCALIQKNIMRMTFHLYYFNVVGINGQDNNLLQKCTTVSMTENVYYLRFHCIGKNMRF